MIDGSDYGGWLVDGRAERKMIGKLGWSGLHNVERFSLKCAGAVGGGTVQYSTVHSCT